MWIRSQNKRILSNVDEALVTFVDENKCFISGFWGTGSDTLGVYSTKEKALKVLDAIQKSKDGVETEIKKQISFHSTLEGALQGYSNCRMADLVSNVDLDLKQVKQAINELREELIIYA